MAENKKILLLSDLDRTIIPNGEQPESAAARPLLRRLAARPEIELVYVSGRDLGLVKAAMAEYGLPWPNYAVCDVGTSIYRRKEGEWLEIDEWGRTLRDVFSPELRDRLVRALTPCPFLSMQEEEKQGTYKLSYYWDPDKGNPEAEVAARLGELRERINLVLSVDEVRNRGLLDLLPQNADKLYAVRFLRRFLGVEPARTVFAGDSGNDLEVMASEIPAVLVANATDEVRREAVSRADAFGNSDRLYLASGGFMGMNGNYSGGVIEGLVHFIPETAAFLLVS